MAGIRRFFKVFLASPNDLAEERLAAKRVVDEYNGTLSEKLGFQAELVGWEDTLPGVGRPQALINRDLDGCDLFVGMLWKRWGTPSDDSGRYTSGFEEEFNLSLERFQRERRPDIHLLLKDVEPSALIDPGEQLKRVQEFRKQVFSERKLLAKTFADLSSFERIFRQCIQGFAIALGEGDIAEEPQRSKSAKKDDHPHAESETLEGADTALSREGVSFLRALLSQLQQEKDYAPTAAQVARFRLLSVMISAQGNDEVSLGVHDSNILYRQRKKTAFSRNEQIALIDAGLDNYSAENVPLWHWVEGTGGFGTQVLAITSIIRSNPARQIAAISAMRLVGSKLANDESTDREQLIQSWFQKDFDKGVKNAAMGYLAEWGELADVLRLREEASRGDSQTESVAVNAILHILAREAPDRVFPSLLELSPAMVEAPLLDQLSRRTDLASELLLKALEQRNADLRVLAVTELRRRKVLPASTAEILLADDSSRVRYEAMLALAAHGKAISIEQAKATLIVKQDSSRRGLGMLAMNRVDTDGETLFDRYVQDQKLTLTEDELQSEAAKAIFEQHAFLALAQKNPEVYEPALRVAVRDQFKERFAAALTSMAERHGGDTDVVDKVRDLEDFLRKKFVRSALDQITSSGSIRDLDLVRETLKSGFVDYSTGDLNFLKKFGDWQDIPAIAASLERPHALSGGALLGGVSGSRYALAAEVIYSLGRERVPELVLMDFPPALLCQVLLRLPPARVREIPTSQLSIWLRSKNTTLRKIVALKTISALSKRTIDKMLTEHLGADEFYYNVIHWLDFGIAVPRQVMLQSCSRAMRDF
ncbi:MAG: DUF4062 domain-containing protein [Rubrivivax sp.]|nr:DUF4062 domain-containing protein [Rubrivivax sp.]